jgi:D-glycero-D-manno-heptose 1,7-bisphosphate phosphatase
VERPFILLDRDGTLVHARPYLSDPAQLELIDGAAEALAALHAMGYGLALITNQSGINRGYFTSARLDAIHSRLCKMLSDYRVELDGIYYCPHKPSENCQCRKPAPGLALTAARELKIDLQRSFVVGDNSCDIGLGESIGATTCLVRTGYGREVEAEANMSPNYIMDDLAGIVSIVQRVSR